MDWVCKDKVVRFHDGVVKIMGIVNVTPDSFSDGGNYLDPQKAVDHALQLVQDGAHIIDLGAQSTRPGYQEISPEEEWERLQPVLTTLRKKTKVPISVDTYFPSVAQHCADNGADIINDVSGVINGDMAAVVRDSKCGWVLMHNGSGGMEDVYRFFMTSMHKCLAYGIKYDHICFDMGIGFGKTMEQNKELIANIHHYHVKGIPLLLGCSRKRVIGAISGQEDPMERTYGNIAADTAAILGGVDIIRLHDVKNEKQGILAAQELRKWIR